MRVRHGLSLAVPSPIGPAKIANARMCSPNNEREGAAVRPLFRFSGFSVWPVGLPQALQSRLCYGRPILNYLVEHYLFICTIFQLDSLVQADVFAGVECAAARAEQQLALLGVVRAQG